MSGVSEITDIGGNTIANQGLAKPQTIADATAIVGAEIDRHLYPADTCLVLAHLGFTSSSGNTTGKNVAKLELFDDVVTGMASEAVFATYSYEYTWVADGVNFGVHVLPVNLTGAKRFIRAKLTLTESGTITIASQTGSVAVVLGGMQKSPGSDYVKTGYVKTTEPA